EQLLFLAGEQVTNFDDDVDDPIEKDLALNVDHIFEANQCDAFDSDVDKAPNIHHTDHVHDDMHEQGVQSMSANKQVKVVNDTLTSELARYKELVGVYEQRAKFELTDRERKIDEC
ncbi:hypothetical protein Tco_0045505, partial [Tanacetum coccineum]